MRRGKNETCVSYVGILNIFYTTELLLLWIILTTYCGHSLCWQNFFFLLPQYSYLPNDRSQPKNAPSPRSNCAHTLVFAIMELMTSEYKKITLQNKAYWKIVWNILDCNNHNILPALLPLHFLKYFFTQAKVAVINFFLLFFFRFWAKVSMHAVYVVDTDGHVTNTHKAVNCHQI